MTDALSIARDLLRCPSVTPADAGALGVLEKVLGDAGFEVHRVTFSEPGAADIDNDVAEFGALHDAVYDFANAVFIFFELTVALRFADALGDDLLGRLGCDAAKFNRRQCVGKLIANNGAGLFALGARDVDLRVFIFNLFHHR